MAIPARRTPFTSMAGQLYPEDDQQDSDTAGPEEDAGGVPDEAPETSPAQPMTQEEMAGKVYLAEAENKDEAQSPPKDQDEEGEDNGQGDDAQEDEESPTQGEHGPAAQAGADRVRSVLGALGIKNEPGSKEAEAMAKLEAGVRKAVADAEASKGAPLTPEEEQNISGEYIANHAMKWLQIGADKLSEAMWKDSEGGSANSKCGVFFRKHFAALGGKLSPDHSQSVKDWGPELVNNGYEPVSAASYEPQDGDIRIYGSVTPRDPKHPNPAEIHGHIQVYNAKHKKWVSEFHQEHEPLQVFDKKDAKFVTYRFNPF